MFLSRKLVPTYAIDTTKYLPFAWKWVTPKRTAKNSHNLYEKASQQILTWNKFHMLIEEYQKANKLNIHKHLLTLIKNKLAQSVFQFVCHQNLKEYLKKNGSKNSTTVTTQDNKDGDWIWHNWVNKNLSWYPDVIQEGYLQLLLEFLEIFQAYVRENVKSNDNKTWNNLTTLQCNDLHHLANLVNQHQNGKQRMHYCYYE